MTASSDPGLTRPDTAYRMVFRLAALPLPTRTVYVRSIHSSVTAATCGQVLQLSPRRAELAPHEDDFVCYYFNSIEL